MRRKRNERKSGTAPKNERPLMAMKAIVRAAAPEMILFQTDAVLREPSEEENRKNRERRTS